MKKCTKCLEEKPFEQFSRRGDGYVSHCKTCRSIAQRAYGKSEKEVERLRAKSRKQKKLAREYVTQLKSAPCEDCGNSYPYYVMQFDHLGDKKYNVAWMVSHGYTKGMIDREVAKCELVCANCHAERTHRRRLDKGLDDVI